VLLNNIVTKMATVCLSMLFLIVTYVPSVYAHSDTHAPSVISKQKHTDAVDKGTSLRIDTENQIASKDRVSTRDDCYTNCCKIFAGIKFCSNTKPGNGNFFYGNDLIYELQQQSILASLLELTYSSLQNTLQYRVLMI
jgi:hypothetical protein